MADRYLNPNKFAEMLQKSDPSKRNAIIEYLTNARNGKTDAWPRWHFRNGARRRIMSFNGSGSYTPPGADFPAVASTLIESTKFNNVVNDIATALSTAICKDGQTTVTANIPLSGYKLTGVGAATARTDAATLATIQDGTGVYVATVAGTADVITLTPSPAITAYAAGQTFRFIASGANSTNVTVNVSALGAKVPRASLCRARSSSYRQLQRLPITGASSRSCRLDGTSSIHLLLHSWVY